MTLLDFFLIVAALSLAGVAVALVPALLQLKRTARKTELLMDTLNRDISPLMRSLTLAAGTLENLTSLMNEQVERVDAFLDTVEDTGRVLHRTSEIIRKAIVPAAAEIGGLGAGIRTFIHFFTRPGKNS
ncbi:MAG: DUF948 domain-containing protein [Desulfobacteraceae bacterium]|nr:DUF948 domain-containing protein [Desulfobacteraceae bacterium]